LSLSDNQPLPPTSRHGCLLTDISTFGCPYRLTSQTDNTLVFTALINSTGEKNKDFFSRRFGGVPTVALSKSERKRFAFLGGGWFKSV
jgi:hypothetical protein